MAEGKGHRTDGQTETSRKKTRPAAPAEMEIEDTPGGGNCSKRRGRRKPPRVPSLNLRRFRSALCDWPSRQIGWRHVDGFDVVEEQVQRVWIFGEGVNSFVSIENIEIGKCRVQLLTHYGGALEGDEDLVIQLAFIMQVYPNFLTIVPSDRRRKPTIFCGCPEQIISCCQRATYVSCMSGVCE